MNEVSKQEALVHKTGLIEMFLCLIGFHAPLYVGGEFMCRDCGRWKKPGGRWRAVEGCAAAQQPWICKDEGR